MWVTPTGRFREADAVPGASRTLAPCEGKSRETTSAWKGLPNESPSGVGSILTG